MPKQASTAGADLKWFIGELTLLTQTRLWLKTILVQLICSGSKISQKLVHVCVHASYKNYYLMYLYAKNAGINLRKFRGRSRKKRRNKTWTRNMSADGYFPNRNHNKSHRLKCHHTDSGILQSDKSLGIL